MNKVLQLKNKLTQLTILDATFQVFGSQTHEYQLNPCLINTDIEVFESKYDVTLPNDYRNFVLELGNGGAGPGYGLYGIPAIESENAISLTSQQNKYDSLSKLFPLKQAWNNLDLVVENKADFLVNLDAYFNQKCIPGTLLLADYGCGIYAILVITGEQRGKIWIDDRTNDNGIYPASLSFCHAFHDADHDDFHPNSDEEQALSFYEWYEDWLNRSLEQIASFHNS
ncbi:SMI1/KNR4 family protein [Nostoc sp. C117]|uniref:SMI1/KNR4 family protein n=1 Tax=Nostoc sp. C117 TaxID=3349875 RepID=UPI00370D56CB